MTENQTANILDIVRGTTVDGPGFRTSIYFAGCRHRCPGCHNPQSWDFEAGYAASVDQLLDVITEEDFDVTLSGGDPLYHPEFVSELVNAVIAARHSVWIYTGFLWEEIVADPGLRRAVCNAEAVVDGPFMESMRDPDLLFRGSSNQRIIDVASSLASATPDIPVILRK